jgi:hypothetical protein
MHANSNATFVGLRRVSLSRGQFQGQAERDHASQFGSSLSDRVDARYVALPSRRVAEFRLHVVELLDALWLWRPTAAPAVFHFDFDVSPFLTS